MVGGFRALPFQLQVAHSWPGGLGEAHSQCLLILRVPRRDTQAAFLVRAGEIENGSDSDPAVRDTALPPLVLFSEENALPPWVIVKFFTCKGCPTRCKQGTCL